MTSPIQTFKENIRPAKLLLQVYSLLDTNDNIVSDGDLVEILRGVVQANTEEELLLVYNEIFLGLVRQGAEIPRASLRRGTLAHLLRQAVVAACTGLDTYLPALLRADLPIVITAQGRGFVSSEDETVNEYLSNLTFSLDEVLRLNEDPNSAEYIANKILNLTNFSYLSTHKGIHVTARFLGIEKPWEMISKQLNRDRKELMTIVNETVKRRNDIVHRADHDQNDPQGEQQEITFAWAKQSVDTIENICLALDEIVGKRMKELQAIINAR